MNSKTRKKPFRGKMSRHHVVNMRQVIATRQRRERYQSAAFRSSIAPIDPNDPIIRDVLDRTVRQTMLKVAENIRQK